MKKLLVKALIIFTGLLILLAILLCFYWRTFRTSNWDKYYFQKIPWREIIADPASHKEPLITFVVILVISILLVIIDEIRLNRKRRYNTEQAKSFISLSHSPGEYILLAILFGLMSVLGILFIIIPFLYEGDFSLQALKANAIYFSNITLTILAMILCIKKYIKYNENAGGSNSVLNRNSTNKKWNNKA